LAGGFWYRADRLFPVADLFGVHDEPDKVSPRRLANGTVATVSIANYASNKYRAAKLNYSAVDGVKYKQRKSGYGAQRPDAIRRGQNRPASDEAQGEKLESRRPRTEGETDDAA
jgi:hypothetical protein